MATVRKNAYKISADEQMAFIVGVNAMINDGSYADLVSDHTEMKHNMHKMMGVIGMWRFLSWHRAYLVEMETQLKKSSKNPDAFIPYWNWIEGGLPEWIGGDAFKELAAEKAAKALPIVGPLAGLVVEGLKPFGGFKPKVPKVKAMDEGGKIIDIENTRNDKPIPDTDNPWPPVKKDIDDLLAKPDYSTFSDNLESYPHNSGHNVLGGAMVTLKSPSDPIFWMHHAQVDRVWASWQKKHPGLGPTFLKGDNLKMDPWNSRTVATLSDISKLGYSYDVLP